MTADALGWHDEHLLDHRRRLRDATCVSLALHGIIFAAFAVAPPRPMAKMPDVIAVDLVVAAAAARPGSRPAEEAAPAEPRATPEPAPPPPAPPLAKAPVQVLPEEAPGRIREAKPVPPDEPKVIAKAEVEPESAPRRPRRRQEALSYEDAMASLDEELGVDETADLLAPPPPRTEAAPALDSSGESGGRPGAVVSPELARWNLATQRLIKSKWVTPPSFRGRGLATRLELRLSATGDVLGEPRVVGSSGDPFSTTTRFARS
ncbi:MAG: hypothetical protein CL908_03040 [Deltaproteobacteria bacterium]|nr:hypothetical protein [Deltaproteobacteria bacterium]